MNCSRLTGFFVDILGNIDEGYCQKRLLKKIIRTSFAIVVIFWFSYRGWFARVIGHTKIVSELLQKTCAIRKYLIKYNFPQTHSGHYVNVNFLRF